MYVCTVVFPILLLLGCWDFLFFICTSPTSRVYCTDTHHSLWNLDHLVTCGIPYANTYGIPRNSAEFGVNCTVKIPWNSAEFRGIPYVFQKIPYSAGSKKSTSVDTIFVTPEIREKQNLADF